MAPTSPHLPGADPAGSPGSGTRTGFDHVYDQPDPRGYFQALGPFGYQTPAPRPRGIPALSLDVSWRRFGS